MNVSSLVRILLVGLFSSIPVAAFAADSTKPPNVVMIISDDQGWGDFGFMGHPQIQTPHLDRLARESLVYRRGYVPSSLCCPSLAAVLTGKYPHQTRITGNEPPRPTGEGARQPYRDPGFLAQVNELNGYMAQHPRLPAEFGKSGYVSFQTGKWWAGNFKTGGFTHGMSHGNQSRGGRHGDEGLEIGRKSMQPVFDFVKEAADRPFFIWYAPMLPHQPHNPPERLLKKYQPLTPSLHVAKYWAMCEVFDESCGQLLGHLQETGKADNTIVVFMIDNGWIQDPDKAAYRSDSKQSQYDGGLRTPIMIRWPGKVMPRFDDTPVSSVDLAPTLYRACGREVPVGLTGVNLLDDKVVTSREAIFGACYLHNAIDIRAPEKNLNYRWCVSGDWKLILPNLANVTKPNKPGREVGIELYQIKTDPTEETNLAKTNPEQVEKLKKLIGAWWTP